MIFGDLATFQMVAVFAFIIATLVLYASEKMPLELTSFWTICALLLFFNFFPVLDSEGNNELSAKVLLAGFANPALLTVLALLVLGEGLARTGVLDSVAVWVHESAKGRPAVAIAIALLVVVLTSAFLNNIPVVVIFVPIMQALAVKIGRPASRYMMSLSFAAILGGMTTLIGSSTNLLVSSALFKLGEPGFEFFSFTVPGLVVASVGLIYVIVVQPMILPDRQSYAAESSGQTNKQFQAQLKIIAGSKYEGMAPVSGFFPDLKGVTVLMILRDEERFLPPYDEIVLQDGDVLVVAATREVLADLLSDEPTLLRPDLANAPAWKRDDVADAWRRGEQTLAEAMIKPDSHYIGKTIKQIDFRRDTQAMIIGVERRSSMRRHRVTETPLEAGDILLIQGETEEVENMRGHRELVLMEWSAANLPKPFHAHRAAAIFGGVVLAAGSGFLPTDVAALTGAAMMVLSGALTLDKALRALDQQIIMLIAAALALGAAMEETGGAAFLSQQLLAIMGDASPALVLSGFFLLVACLANVLSTKATAVLFTPIAVAVAHETNMPVEPFAVAVVFAANCSFASPVGYQTNLLVMAPGHYRFLDFIKFGSPLILICWLTFSLFAPWWYGI
ncbi:SLC13 family permease [Aestuariispira ectoiniformans]|uniref:SLC13 family permease n=1 Tax=Aestuariispira ectoiniformans TaxID=2775080 RepID=UPI0021E343FC|nr:SLC13 family permease [Aestuariispira ectoiniformans]